MSFLSAAQSAAIRLIGRRPSTFFSSQQTFELEMADLANEVAADLMRSVDWRVLTQLNVFNGDGVERGFPLPVDYDRMVTGGDVFRPDWATWRYTPAADLNQWRDLLNGQPTVVPGFWIILDGLMSFAPIISLGDSAQFYYISKNIVLGADSSLKPAFTGDDDTLRVDERLLTLGLIWRWRAQKRLEYAEDMANYEKALAEVQGREKGSRVLYDRSRRFNNLSLQTAYPYPLG